MKLSNKRWHASKDLMVPDNVTLLILPPYAPELNPVENVWQHLRANKLAITVFDGYADIVDKCCTAWNFFANDTAAIATITTRKWTQVNLWGCWYKSVKTTLSHPATPCPADHGNRQFQGNRPVSPPLKGL